MFKQLFNICCFSAWLVCIRYGSTHGDQLNCPKQSEAYQVGLRTLVLYQKASTQVSKQLVLPHFEQQAKELLPCTHLCASIKENTLE